MRVVNCDLAPAGKDWTTIELLKANPRYVHFLRRQARPEDTPWRHKQQGTHRGDVKLFQSGGKFWGQIRDHSTAFTGAFLGWIVRNASDLIYRIEFWLD
jgi:hypothetical protein